MSTIHLTVNGHSHDLDVHEDRLLVDVLRDDLKLTGTKKGCDRGICGSCAVIMDGRLARSCVLPAIKADGADILTVESLGDGDSLSSLQKAFIFPPTSW